MLQPEPADQPVATPKHLGWLKSISGELASATLARLEETLPWYRAMPPARRAAVGAVAQTGISSFVEWYENPTAQPWVAADVFASAPRELLRSVSLQETLQVIRVVVEVVETRVIDELPDLREAILRYSREIAFSAADVYARAAEARGLWDARLEALVVDSIISGENANELASRVAALGWRAQGPVAVLLGAAPASPDPDNLRKVARKLEGDLLIGYHGNRQVAVLGFSQPPSKPAQAFLDFAKALESSYGPESLVLGVIVPSISYANRSARTAIAAAAVATAAKASARPILADDLLAERVLLGDSVAKATLLDDIYLPLANTSPDLLDTLRSYLFSGRSLEATAKALFVHPNTVRYRLKRVQELIGWDPTDAKDSFILQVAMVTGGISDVETGLTR
jgi:DNA-binding PucR family transcriptional regulator